MAELTAEQKKIRRRAEEFEKKYGTPSAPEEAGLEEEGFLDVAKPYKKSILGGVANPMVAGALDLAIPDSPLYMLDKAAGTARKLKKEAGVISKMRQESAPAKKAWHELSEEERKATTFPNFLTNQKKTEGFGEADALRSVKTPEGTSLNYTKINKPTGQSEAEVIDYAGFLKPSKGDSGNVWRKPGKPEDRELIRDLQEEMQSLASSGNHKEAREIQKKIRDIRENPRWEK